MGGDLARRDLFRRGGLLATAAALAGCDALSTNPSGSDRGSGTGNSSENPKEAPMLAQLVKNGRIPKLEKRLPPKPLVVEPADRIGRYDGEWRMTAVRNPATTGQVQDIDIGYENLVRWDTEFKKIIPNVAQRWESNSDSTEYTFHLHPGIKWSDGHPFTADDVVFAVNDILMNSEINPTPPYGEMSAERVDADTVKVRFKDPNGLFIVNMATQRGNQLTDYPQHYLKQFHRKYNPKVETEAKKEHYDNWVALFDQRSGDYSYGTNPDKPTLKPWVLKSNTKTELVVERNPFYWKVDPQGSQLPYIDRMTWQYVADEQTGLLKVTNGEVDFSYEDPSDKPVLARSRDRGKYRFFNAVPAHMNDFLIYFNLAHKDPVLRQVFNNRDFRVGLSYAIDRRELINAVFQRQGEPWQIAPRKESSYYDDELAHQYLEYDVKLANEHLDKAFPKKNSSGQRLGPDGRPITFQVDAIAQYSQSWVDGMQLVSSYWKKVGVTARVNSLSPSLAITRANANEHDAEAYAGEDGFDATILINTFNFIPVTSPYCFFGVPWATWYSSGGKDGEEPPPLVKRQLELYDKVKATSDPDRQHQLMTAILDLSKQQFVGIGTVAPTSEYGIISTRTQNFPKYHVTGTVWVYMDPAATNPSQYFLEG